MSLLRCEAFDLTDNFIKFIKETHNVIVLDSTNSPYEVVFKGDIDDLIDMYNGCWVDAVIDEIDETSTMLSEE